MPCRHYAFIYYFRRRRYVMLRRPAAAERRFDASANLRSGAVTPDTLMPLFAARFSGCRHHFDITAADIAAEIIIFR